MTPEQREAADAYDAACARRQRLIDEAETLIAELEALADRTEDVVRYDRIRDILDSAMRRYIRRFAADVEF